MRPKPDRANQAVYVWSRIDPRTNRLIGDKLRRATLKLKQEIDRETNRIRLQNRLNLNKTGVDHQIARMWAGKIQAHVEMCYDKIYCHHWSLLGHGKTGAFVRACSALLGRSIERLGSTEAHKARMAHRREGGIRQSVEGLYTKSAGLLRMELEEQLDIEARELDLAASIGRAQENAASAPQPEPSKNPPVDISPAHPSGVLKLGDEMVIECGPLSAEETDTTAPAIELLRKLGFCDEQQQWPSSLFGPVLPYVLEQLKRAHQILTTRGFVFVGDPLNPLGDGKSWVLKCEPPIELPNDSDPARLAHQCLQKAGINVATRPVLDGDTLLIPLWDSGKEFAGGIDDSGSGTAKGVQHEVGGRGLGEQLQFVRRGDEIVVARCNDIETAVATTCEAFISYMGQAKSIVRSRGSKVTVTHLRRHFKNTDFAKALDAEDWQTLIEEFSSKRPAGLKNLTVALLARRTGLTNETVKTYAKPSRRRKRTALE